MANQNVQSLLTNIGVKRAALLFHIQAILCVLLLLLLLYIKLHIIYVQLRVQPDVLFYVFFILLYS
jgi:hypothetical protein